MQLSAEITSRGASFPVTVRGAVILVGVAQLVELEAGAPVTEHSRRRFDSGHQQPTAARLQPINDRRVERH